MDAFEKFTEQKNKLNYVVKNGFKQSINYILLLFLVGMTLILSYAIPSFYDGISSSMLINTGYLVIADALAMIMFVPQGEGNEMTKNISYQNNMLAWSKKSNSVRKDKHLMDFRAYCQEVNERLRKEKREQYIQNANIEPEFYHQVFEKLTIKELRKYLKPQIVTIKNFDDNTQKYNEIKINVQLSKMQFKMLKKAKGRIKIARLEPMRVLAGSETRGEYKIAQQKIKYSTKNITSRLLMVVAYSLLLGSVILVPNGQRGLMYLFSVIMRLTGIITSTFIGFYSGVKNIKNANEEAKERIIFIDEFYENKGFEFVEEKKDTV